VNAIFATVQDSRCYGKTFEPDHDQAATGVARPHRVTALATSADGATVIGDEHGNVHVLRQLETEAAK
jgi:hypothetical protein